MRGFRFSSGLLPLVGCVGGLLALGCSDQLGADAREESGDSSPHAPEPEESPTSPSSPGGDDISIPGDTPCAVSTDCDPGSYCSVAQICVLEGKCGAAGDCAPEAPVCTTASGVCVAAGGCVEDADCAAGQICDEATSMCVAGGDCGSSEFEADRLPPNVMLLMDRSGSMSRKNDAGESRWEIAKSALFAVLDQVGGSAHFGLTSYSACLEGGCAPGVNEVPVAEDGSQQVRTFLEPRTACSYKPDATPNDAGEVCYLCNSGAPETSTGKSLAALVGEPQLQDPNRDNAVVLLTDGHESGECVENEVDAPAGAALLLAQDIPVPTYVIGFSGDVDEEELEATALAGGTQEPILASDLTALEEAFRAIVKNVLSCEFVLRQTPPDANDLYVFLNDDTIPLPRDDPNGWSYSPERNAAMLVGASCEALKAAQIEDVSIVYGCPERVIR